MRRLSVLTFLLFALLVAAVAIEYARKGAYGLNAILRQGVYVWGTVDRDDPRLTPAVRLALKGATPSPGAVVWNEKSLGFETGELPILVDGKEADRLLLARIDPARWRISAHNAPAGDHDLDRWMAELKATLVVNGSYFGMRGQPDTPFRSQGQDLGPHDYKAAHGAFVASPGRARIVDLEGKDWREAFEGADDALVSYPILLDAKGRNRAAPSKWLANRSFIGQDSSGRIIIGTTADALLSLDRLGYLLRAAPLDLTLALNLDGGPVACQAVSIGGFRRNQCGTMELQVEGDRVRLLKPLIRGGNWALPIVLAVTPR
jgi:hypothetical protein